MTDLKQDLHVQPLWLSVPHGVQMPPLCDDSIPQKSTQGTVDHQLL